MKPGHASLALAGAALLLGTQVWSQAGADAPAPPTQRGGAPMPKPVTLADRPNATGGEALYVEYCAMCHAPNGMGHGLLARRVDTPDLEKRDNLPAEYVVLAARQGIGNMPAIPRGEVSDADLQSIADYLAAGPHGGGQ
jgi:mono/diheme cytochrome c family protein